MERCDFSSVITIINDHISESKRGNQSDLMYALYEEMHRHHRTIQLGNA